MATTHRLRQLLLLRRGEALERALNSCLCKTKHIYETPLAVTPQLTLEHPLFALGIVLRFFVQALRIA